MVRSAQAEAIAAEPGVDCRRMEDDSLMLRLSSPEEKQKVMRHLTDTYDIDEVRVFEPSLNDIFVEYASDMDVEEGEQK